MTTKIYDHAFRAALERSEIPPLTQESIALYVLHAIQPGHFLTAALAWGTPERVQQWTGLEGLK